MTHEGGSPFLIEHLVIFFLIRLGVRIRGRSQMMLLLGYGKPFRSDCSFRLGLKRGKLEGSPRLIVGNDVGKKRMGRSVEVN